VPSSRSIAVSVLIAGLAATTVVTAQPVLANPSAAAATAAVEASVAAPTNLATPAQKVKAAGALGISPGTDMLVLNDQNFALSLFRQARDGSFVKAAALRAYDTTEPEAAYQFIVTGIFEAAAEDAAAEIAEARARALRRSVAVTVGLDPSDTALIEKNDRDFIFSVFQRVESGSFVWTAARDAIADGTDADDWTAFLTTGAAEAAERDMAKKIAEADAELAAQLAAQQLATAKKSLLQLLLLPVTDELVNAPDRQYVLHVHGTAKGTEVKLAAQAALNASDADLAQALKDFIFTDGAAANTRDEAAAAARELADYKTRVTAIRDAAARDGLEVELVAAANQALTTGTLLSLQTFLLKGQDDARAKDRRARATVVLAGDRVGVLSADGTAWIRDGALTLTTEWINEHGGIKQYVLSGTRIGVLTNDGTALVKDGGLSAAWDTQLTGVKQLALSGDRIGVLTYDGTARVKAGALNATWSIQWTGGVKQIALAGTRIGVLTTDGVARVKDGSLNETWTVVNTGIKELALTSNRIGVLTNGGTPLVKEGTLHTQWINEYPANGITSLALDGDRIGIVLTNGDAQVKAGGLSAPWVPVYSGITRLALAGDRVGVLLPNGDVLVKDGGLSASWVPQRSVI
jgi:hypothetical protein